MDRDFEVLQEVFDGGIPGSRENPIALCADALGAEKVRLQEGHFYQFGGALAVAVDVSGSATPCGGCPFSACVAADCGEVNDDGQVLCFAPAE